MFFIFLAFTPTAMHASELYLYTEWNLNMQSLKIVSVKQNETKVIEAEITVKMVMTYKCVTLLPNICKAEVFGCILFLIFAI